MTVNHTDGEVDEWKRRVEDLRAQLAEALNEKQRFKGDYLGAAKLAADMLAQVRGVGNGPLRGPVEDIADVVAQLAAAAAREAGLRAELEAISQTFESAVLHAENKGKGGQQVPFHQDFGHVAPSDVGRMRWWAARFRAALAADPSPVVEELRAYREWAKAEIGRLDGGVDLVDFLERRDAALAEFRKLSGR